MNHSSRREHSPADNTSMSVSLQRTQHQHTGPPTALLKNCTPTHGCFQSGYEMYVARTKQLLMYFHYSLLYTGIQYKVQMVL